MQRSAHDGCASDLCGDNRKKRRRGTTLGIELLLLLLLCLWLVLLMFQMLHRSQQTTCTRCFSRRGPFINPATSNNFVSGIRSLRCRGTENLLHVICCTVARFFTG